MNTNEVTTQLPTGSTHEPVADSTGQLVLLPAPVVDQGELAESDVQIRFRLSKKTRERGLRHVAEIRAQLAASKDRSERPNVVTLPPRRQPAA